MRGAEDAVVCLMTDSECIESARAEGRHVEVRDEDGTVVETYPAPPSDVDVNNAFAPGQRIVFYEDYANDPVGNFPARLEFVSGNWEVASWQGRRLMRTTGPRGAAFRISLPEALPDSFTIETEVYFARASHRLLVMTQPPQKRGGDVDYNFFQIAIGNGGSGVQAYGSSGLPTSLNATSSLTEELVPIHILVEGEYVKVFIDNDRVANIPNAYLPRSEALYFESASTQVTEDHPLYIGPLRVAAIETE